MPGKKILIITDSYPPEIRSASHLMHELACELQARGHKVRVATTWPRYNLSENSRKNYAEISNESGVAVLRIKTLAHHGVNYIYRGIAEVLMPWLFFRKLKQHDWQRPDLVIVYSPPLSLGIVGAQLKKKFGSRVIINLQDIFPQNAIDLGVLKNKWLIKILKTIEKKIYEMADVVTVHSAGNCDLLKKSHPELTQKFAILHNWVDLSAFDPSTSSGKLKQDYGLANKVVVVFAGVMGPAQGLDFVLEVARELKTHPELQFLLVGDGVQKQKLQDYAKTHHLDNVIFKPFISKNEYAQLLRACDIGLVSLSTMNKTPVVPGKLQGYMAAAVPILGILNKESDGHQLIVDSGCGYTVAAGELSLAVDMFKEALADISAFKQRGARGFAYAQQHFSHEACVTQLENLFKIPIPK